MMFWSLSGLTFALSWDTMCFMPGRGAPEEGTNSSSSGDLLMNVLVAETWHCYDHSCDRVSECGANKVLGKLAIFVRS